MLRGRGPGSGLTDEFWVSEEHHLIVFEQIRDWAGRLTATLSWKHQALNPPLPPESFIFTPPAGAIQTADRLGPPEPHCADALSFIALPGETAPSAFALPDENGQTVRSTDWNGPVTLIFWHTWSPIAIPQLQAVAEFQENPGVPGVTILGYTDEPPEVVSEFLRKNGLTLRTIIDPQHTAGWLYAQPQVSMPCVTNPLPWW